MLSGVMNTKAGFRRVRQGLLLAYHLASKEGRALSSLFWTPLVPDNATQNSGMVISGHWAWHRTVGMVLTRHCVQLCASDLKLFHSLY